MTTYRNIKLNIIFYTHFLSWNIICIKTEVAVYMILNKTLMLRDKGEQFNIRQSL